MEYLRGGVDNTRFQRRIERTITAFNNRLDSAQAANQTEQNPKKFDQRQERITRLNRHVERLLDTLVAVEDGTPIPPVTPLHPAPARAIVLEQPVPEIIPPVMQEEPQPFIHKELTEDETPASGISTEVFTLTNPSRAEHRRHAVERISEYLNTPGEKIIREHQVDVFVSLLTHFASGLSSGTIVLPTGSGKTHVAAELIKVLGLKSVVFSNSKDILAQNGKTLKAVTGMNVTNFFGNEKNTQGDVINTLYQSFPSLQKKEGIDFKEIGLVVYDEADLALGEQRHKIHEMFPNALKIALTATPAYEQLEGYKDRGLITGEEEWVNTFKTIIHEMSIEEALARKVIPPLDIHLVTTGNAIPKIETGPSGAISAREVAQYINTRSRNAFALGMIAGLEAVPSNINISDKNKEEIKKIHEKIKGKRTLIHAANVAHILSLEKQLQEAGISAKGFYGDMHEKRQDVIAQVKSGEIQVLIGDQLTGRGLDIPELEVGIHASPTFSSRELAQQVGRLFRHSPETGKEKGIVIQLVDSHASSLSNQPVLVPSIFDPDFVIRGTTRGRAPYRREPGSSTSTRRASDFIQIEGSIDLDAYFEEIRLQDLIASRFKNATMPEMNAIIMDLYNNYMAQAPTDVSAYECYTYISRTLPARISSEVNHRALSAVDSQDSAEAHAAAQVLVAVNLKTILPIVSRYFTSDAVFNNDLTQHVMANIVKDIQRAKDSKLTIAQIFHQSTRLNANNFTAEKLSMPITWVERNVHFKIRDRVSQAFAENPHGLDQEKGTALVDELVTTLAVSRKSAEDYINKRNDEMYHAPVFIDDVSTKALLAYEVNKALDSLVPRERMVILQRFVDGKTLAEIGEIMQITRERVRIIEADALRKLQRPSIRKRLESYLD